MRKIILTITGFLVGIHSFGQLSYDNAVQFAGSDLIYIHCKADPDHSRKPHYLDEEWNWGSIQLLDTSKVIKGYPIRYDVLNGIVEIKTIEETKYIEDFKLSAFKYFDNQGKELFFINSKLYNLNIENQMLQVLVNGETKLFKETIVSRNQEDALNYGVSPSLKTVSVKHKFYVLKGDKIKEIRRKKRDLLNYFGEKAKDVVSYVKENKLRYSKEAHMKRIVEYYNSII